VDAPLTALPALVLCGGAGTRLGADAEKPLVTVCGEPMFDRVVRTLRQSRVSTVHAVPSPRTPETRARAVDLGVDVVDAPGDGYVADLRHALDAVDPPVVTVVSDLPHVAPTHVDGALGAAVGTDGTGIPSVTVCVPVSVKRSLGASVDTAFEHDGRRVAPTGLNVVAPGETENVSIVADERLAVNVNRPSDRALAESLCG
jgi:adenosylcobinamide-phosphate guanylyltransferase